MKKNLLSWLKGSKSLTDSQNLEFEKERNEYYEAVSVRFGYAQVVLFVLLFVFVVLSFLRNTELITYRNFYYFFKDLNTSAQTVNLLDADHVTYPTSEEQSFTLYRNGLAVAGNRSVTVFSASGRQTVSKLIDNYHHPIAVGSGKYLLVYESGGTKYSVYNFYSQIYAGTTDHPIQAAVAADCGMYALITSSEAYTSVVSLYNDRFELVNRYCKNAYVMDVDINAKGTALAILSSSVKGGAFSTSLEIYETKNTSEAAVLSLGSSIGIDCYFSDASHLSVLCGNEIYFVKQNGTLQNQYSFEGKRLHTADLTQDGAAICLQDTRISEKNSIIVFDKTGNLLYNEAIPEKAEQIARRGNHVYVVSSGGIRRISLRENEEDVVLQADTEGRVLLAINEKEILLCSPQKAVYFNF